MRYIWIVDFFWRVYVCVCVCLIYPRTFPMNKDYTTRNIFRRTFNSTQPRRVFIGGAIVRKPGHERVTDDGKPGDDEKRGRLDNGRMGLDADNWLFHHPGVHY